jgi:hypothetical protein
MTSNEYTYTAKIKRRELCDLLIACDLLSQGNDKWSTLHDKLKAQLDEQDEKRGA